MTLNLLWQYKHWIAIAVFFVLWLGQIVYTNHLSGKLRKASEQCTSPTVYEHLTALHRRWNCK